MPCLPLQDPATCKNLWTLFKPCSRQGCRRSQAWSCCAGLREAYNTPGSRLQRAGSPAGCEAGGAPSEWRQLARELSAEALAAEYDRSAESGYAEV